MENEKSYLEQLNKIGIALSAEKDTDKLLDIILQESIHITKSDAGSLYIKEESEEGKPQLRFKISTSFSRNVPFKEFTLPLNHKSISGYVALTGKVLNLENVKNIPPEHGLTYNDSFDKQINYKTVNMLVIPMKDYNEEVVGVLQLINKKKDANLILGEPEEIEDKLESYPKKEEEIILSLASQAAILLERTKLYNEIEELFQSFIVTMVATLESRDKTTSGHSRRLAGYAAELAKKINEIDYGRYKDMSFSKDEIREIYYSALLHDIGKIGVRESILTKRNRLEDSQIEAVKYRFAYIKESLSRKEELSEKEKELLLNIQSYYDSLEAINKKGFIKDEEEELLIEIKNYNFIDIDGEERPLLKDEEYKNLSIKRGNLTSEERQEMNSHASYSEKILKGIKWTNGLAQVSQIAGAHHEKLDGTGYPKGIKEDEILLQSKILAVLDIFEALTAEDRPYKPAMEVSRALSILQEEVDRNHLDKDIYEIFVNEKIFEMYKTEINKIIKI